MPCVPVGHDAGVVTLLVLINAFLRVAVESSLLPVGPDGGGSLDRLREVRVDGRPTDRVKPL